MKRDLVKCCALERMDPVHRRRHRRLCRVGEVRLVLVENGLDARQRQGVRGARWSQTPIREW